MAGLRADGGGAGWCGGPFLLGWIYLAIEMVATGVVELMDDRAEPLVPRWFTDATFFGVVALLEAAGPAFFQSGPFAYHGLLAFYLPVVIWAAYLLLTTWFMLKALGREAAARAEPADVLAS